MLQQQHQTSRHIKNIFRTLLIVAKLTQTRPQYLTRGTVCPTKCPHILGLYNRRRRWHRREIRMTGRGPTGQELSPGPDGQSGSEERRDGDRELGGARGMRPLLVHITAALRRLIAIVRSAIKQELHDAKLTGDQRQLAEGGRAGCQRQATIRLRGMAIGR